jgi:hypothetical protein
LYISEYVEGNFNEEIEWPISSKIFKSKIQFEESEIMIKEREFFLNLKKIHNDISFTIVKLIIEDQTSNLTLLAEGKL